jgi:hypothetical protein
MARSLKVVVIINEQHKLLPDQERLLNHTFPEGWSRWDVPADGLTAAEQAEAAADLCEEPVIIASPVPFLTARLAAIKAARAQRSLFIDTQINIWVFHNDKRVAKEIPDGKGGVRVVHTVAPEGWQLLEV